MDKEQIIQMALQHGFMLSTSYGQEAKKLMPVSDSGTIIAFAAAIRAATKEEDAKICEEVFERLSKIESDSFDPGYSQGGAAECAETIRASK